MPEMFTYLMIRKDGNLCPLEPKKSCLTCFRTISFLLDHIKSNGFKVKPFKGMAFRAINTFDERFSTDYKIVKLKFEIISERKLKCTMDKIF